MEKASIRSEHAMNRWRVYGLGEWGQTKGACITDYKWCHKGGDNEFYDLDGKPLEGFKPCGIGLDFGDNDPNAGIRLYKDESGRFIAEEVLYQSKLDLSTIYNRLHKYGDKVHADYSWPQSIRELSNRGLDIVRCEKGPDSIKNGIDLINDVEIYIVRGSNNLAKEIQVYRYKEDKDGNLVDGKYEGPDHAIDALRYVLVANSTKKEFKVINLWEE